MNAEIESLSDVGAIWRAAIQQLEARRGATGKLAQVERYMLIVFHLCCGGGVSTYWLRQSLGLSKATAKRDMLTVEMLLPVERHQEIVNSDTDRPQTVLRIRHLEDFQ